MIVFCDHSVTSPNFQAQFISWFFKSSLVCQEPVSERECKPPAQSSAPAHQVWASLPSQGPEPRHDWHRACERRDHGWVRQHHPRPQRVRPLPWGQRVQLRELVWRQRGARGSAWERQLPPPASVQSGGAPQSVSKTGEVNRGLDHMIGSGLQPEGVEVLVKLPYSVIINIIIFFLYWVGVLYVQCNMYLRGADTVICCIYNMCCNWICTPREKRWGCIYQPEESNSFDSQQLITIQISTQSILLFCQKTHAVCEIPGPSSQNIKINWLNKETKLEVGTNVQNISGFE